MYFYKCMFGAIWWLQEPELKDLKQCPGAWCMKQNSCHNITWTGWWDNEGVWKHTAHVCEIYIFAVTLKPERNAASVKGGVAYYCWVVVVFFFLQVAPPSKKGASSLWARSGAEQTVTELVSHSQCGEILDQSRGCSHRNLSPTVTCGNNSQRMSNAWWGCSFIQAWTWNLCGTPWLCVGWKKRRRIKNRGDEFIRKRYV